jgi:hypothetical protein
MMRIKQSARPMLEGLEQRWVPATIKVVSGNLYVSAQVGTLTVTTLGSGKVTVDDSGKAVTVSGVGGLISITGTNAANTINFRATTAFGGNVLINSGNGNDAVNLRGTVGGSMTLQGGYGDDTTTVDADLTVGGSVTSVDNYGANSLLQTGVNLTVGGSLSVTGVGTYSNAGGRLKVGTDASFNMAGNSGKVLTMTVTGLSTSVGRMLSVTGGSLNDSVDFTGTDLSVGSTATFSMGNGDNTLTLAPGAGGTGFNGNLTATFGIGDDTVTGGANLLIGGNASFDFGGAATVAGNVFNDDSASLYSGNLSLTGGNDTNDFDIDGAISGGLNVTVGNGTSTTTFTGTVAGTLRYRGGNGTDTLEVTPAAAETVTIDAIFGTGTSTLTLNANLTLDGRVEGTGGSYTFNQNGATLAPTLQFINFP